MEFSVQATLMSLFTHTLTLILFLRNALLLSLMKVTFKGISFVRVLAVTCVT